MKTLVRVGLLVLACCMATSNSTSQAKFGGGGQMPTCIPGLSCPNGAI